MKFNTIQDAIYDIKKGKFVIVVDDENRENEGDLVMAAQKITPVKVNFMLKHGRGLICAPMSETRLQELRLEPMVQKNEDSFETNFTVSCDVKEGTTTGISAYDRAKTILALADKKMKARNFSRPGHIFPLQAREEGVLRRAGHTEASVDLAKLAGLYSAGVICEIVSDSGRMARLPELFKLAKKFNLKIITIADLIKYRKGREKQIEKMAEADLPTKSGNFKIYVYQSELDKLNHVALVRGKIEKNKEILVRVHSKCLTGDIFGSLRCDCGEQLIRALKVIGQSECGVLLYMNQEGRGIGLVNKIKAYVLQDKGLDTVEANHRLGFNDDLRDYGLGAQILYDLGVRKIKLLTNNPRKVIGLAGYGLKIVKRLPLEIKPNGVNLKYLMTKKEKMGHELKMLQRIIES